MCALGLDVRMFECLREHKVFKRLYAALAFADRRRLAARFVDLRIRRNAYGASALCAVRVGGSV